MKLLIEEYQYDSADVVNVLDGFFTLQDVEQKVSVSYVGYYYNPHEKIKDVVFILPKVLIDEHNKVFGKYDPKSLIYLEEAKIQEHERKFLYEFAVWIHRAIVVFNETKKDNKIVLHKQIAREGRGTHKKKSNTLLDIILSLILFNKENQQFFTFIMKNIHAGFNKINWGKTISNTTAMVEGNSPVYLTPFNKKRMVNFDEELIIIFFSILQYVTDRFGFHSKIPFGFKLITGNNFERFLKGYGRTRLREIKYKYYSDTSVKLWDLCYAFFEKFYQIRMNDSQSEYLLVKSFHIVFEAMIDELIGTPHDKLPPGLADQYDGKLVDHFYTYEGLLIDKKEKFDNDIYYIGDSKYYKMGNSLGAESIYKQRTYARNVIQWNLDIWLNDKHDKSDHYESIKLFDEVTEGYNIIPNFFISAAIDKDTLSYEDHTVPHDQQPPISRQFKNRLYDRDTLLLSHYDVNFLFVVALYARDNAAAKAAWRERVRVKFRNAVQEMLKTKFDFYALAAHPDVDAEVYLKSHFQETLGKTFRPFDNKGIFSLALDKKYPEDNSRLIERLSKNFFVIDCPLGTNPEIEIKEKNDSFGDQRSTDHEGLVFVVYVPADERDKYKNNDVKNYRSRSLPEGNIQEISYLAPMIDGYINGYYDVAGITFSISKKDGKPRVTFSLGDFHKLGDDIALVKRNGIYLLNYGGKPIPLHKLKQTYDEAPKFINMNLEFFDKGMDRNS